MAKQVFITKKEVDYLSNSNYILTSNGELYHHGVKGQKWGVRRYQNRDGSLTVAGQRRNRKLLDKRKLDKLAKDETFVSEAARIKNSRDEYMRVNDEYEHVRLKYMSNPHGQGHDVYEIMVENDDTLRSWYENETDPRERKYWKDAAIQAMASGAHDHSDLYMQTCHGDLAQRRSDAWEKYHKTCEESAKKMLGKYADMGLRSFEYRKTVEEFITNNSDEIDHILTSYSSHDNDDSFDYRDRYGDD